MRLRFFGAWLTLYSMIRLIPYMPFFISSSHPIPSHNLSFFIHNTPLYILCLCMVKKNKKPKKINTVW
jgi:hypothetical protein